MEKISNLDELIVYLRANIDNTELLAKETDRESFDEFQKGFNSGYANSYADLLCVLDNDYRIDYEKLIANNEDK